MYYDYAITVPANTTEDDPVTQVIELTAGVIYRLEVHFPIGCFGLAHCQIRHHETQHWPSNLDGSFATDGYAIVIDELFDLNAEPYTLKAICWNDDDTYQHVITVRVGVLRGILAVTITRLLNGMTKFLQLAGVRI